MTMVETRMMDKIQRDLIKKYHTLCGLLGLTDDERMSILLAYGVESSRDMDTHDLIDVCGKLSNDLERRKGRGGDELSKLRKRAMAAIGGWMKATGRHSDSNIIKGIACRATGYTEFNKIPRERLRNLVYAFNNKVKDLEAVGRLTPSINVESTNIRAGELVN